MKAEKGVSELLKNAAREQDQASNRELSTQEAVSHVLGLNLRRG